MRKPRFKRWMYTVQFNEKENRHQIHRIDREDAYALAMSGSAIEAFDTVEQASREMVRLRNVLASPIMADIEVN